MNGSTKAACALWRVKRSSSSGRSDKCWNVARWSACCGHWQFGLSRRREVAPDREQRPGRGRFCCRWRRPPASSGSGGYPAVAQCCGMGGPSYGPCGSCCGSPSFCGSPCGGCGCAASRHVACRRVECPHAECRCRVALRCVAVRRPVAVARPAVARGDAAAVFRDFHSSPAIVAVAVALPHAARRAVQPAAWRAALVTDHLVECPRAVAVRRAEARECLVRAAGPVAVRRRPTRPRASRSLRRATNQARRRLSRPTRLPRVRPRQSSNARARRRRGRSSSVSRKARSIRPMGSTRARPRPNRPA